MTSSTPKPGRAIDDPVVLDRVAAIFRGARERRLAAEAAASSEASGSEGRAS